MFRIIAKEELIIIDEYSIPIAYSEPLPTKQAALEWVALRGLRSQVKIITESLFQQNTKVIPRALTDEDIHLNYAIYQAKSRLK